VNSTRTIAFHTLGCKLNFAETSAIGKQLVDSGYRKVLLHEKPDVFLLNTCSVTENADRECRSVVNRALAGNPDTIVVVTGCFAQLKPESIASIPGVDLVLGAGEKFNAAKYLNQLLGKGSPQIHSCEISSVTDFHASSSSGDRTRVFLKVQDGCDYQCSFCTIPLARGASRSDSIENVVNRVNEAALLGAREIVLTGVNLGDFGIEDVQSGNRTSTFFDLVKELEKITDINRFRISSIEPNLLEDRIVRFVSESKRFVPHFHIPLQSGSDKILKLMRRRYLIKLYSDRIMHIRKLMPHASIGVDVITGFPGETYDDFMETVEFLKQLPVTYFHVFTYSERENTYAATLDGVVPVAERKQRTRILRQLSDKKQRSFNIEHLGTIRPVLFEGDCKDGFMHGYTDNYIRVRTSFDETLVNQVILCRLNRIEENGDISVSLMQPATLADAG
jgi:threonylcarbamoyladenosine tRNA methylthiotransferase MtaB